jgi:hypothetical protein
MSLTSLNVVRCEALFASSMQRCDDAELDSVRTVITRAVRELGIRGCAAQVAQEFGDHPDMAVLRMCWARGVVALLYGLDDDSTDPAGSHRGPTGVASTRRGKARRQA